MITTNKKDLEFVCDGVYHTDALKIAKRLKLEVLLPKNKHCIGLAHNQIKGSKKVFIAKINNKWRSFINAEIVDHKQPYECIEQCMSFPNKSNKVKRYNLIKVNHQIKARSDYSGNAWIIESFSGSNAQVIQHEIDHLNGIHIFNKGKG